MLLFPNAETIKEQLQDNLVDLFLSGNLTFWLKTLRFVLLLAISLSMIIVSIVLPIKIILF